jgi:hypothetical protein
MQKIRLPTDKKIPTNPRFATVETRLNTGRTKDKVLTDQMVTMSTEDDVFFVPFDFDFMRLQMELKRRANCFFPSSSS